MTVFAKIGLMLTWLPIVVKFVALAEVMFDADTPGPEKKAAVLAQLSEVAEKLNLPWGPAAIEVISDLIDAAVRTANFVGRFRKAGVVEGTPEEVARANVTERASEDEALSAFLEATAR